jgi:signal peptidase II
LFSGAIGNFIDRVSQNYVTDFLYFSLINFPIFNVADIYVTVSVLLFVILLLWYYKEEELNQLSAQLFPRRKQHE